MGPGELEPCWGPWGQGLGGQPPAPLVSLSFVSNNAAAVLTRSFPGPRCPFSVDGECLFAAPARTAESSCCRAGAVLSDGSGAAFGKVPTWSLGRSQPEAVAIRPGGKFIFLLETSEYLTLLRSLSK